MNIFISAGEPSGDHHGAQLIRQLIQQRPGTRCVGFGGTAMARAGCHLLHDMTPLALMFVGRVLLRLPTFWRLLRQTTRYFRDHQVDAVVLIDYPGFNWCVARRAKRFGIPVFYYGAPQIWAWAPWRVRKLRRLVDHVLCQLPFEPQWYAQRQCPATFVGHPFFDRGEDPAAARSEEPNASDAPLLLLLPGSRRSEIVANTLCFLDAAERVVARQPDTRVAFACHSESDADYVREAARGRPFPVDVVAGQTTKMMRAAHVALACSGSVSLQLLAARLPTVIYFRITRLQWVIQALLMRVRYITLVNLIWTSDIRRKTRRTFDPDRPGAEPVPMPEYLTTRYCPDRLAERIMRWLDNPAERESSWRTLDQLAKRTAVPGASARAARWICQTLDQHTQHARVA
jgi:lipid-A-disaccharide synthase